jgi:hypothetical protein
LVYNPWNPTLVPAFASVISADDSWWLNTPNHPFNDVIEVSIDHMAVKQTWTTVAALQQSQASFYARLLRRTEKKPTHSNLKIKFSSLLRDVDETLLTPDNPVLILSSRLIGSGTYADIDGPYPLSGRLKEEQYRFAGETNVKHFHRKVSNNKNSNIPLTRVRPRTQERKMPKPTYTAAINVTDFGPLPLLDPLND